MSDSEDIKKKNDTVNDSGNFQKLGQTVLGYIDKGVEASRKGLHTMGNAISDFGDRSVLRIELENLKGKRKKTFTNLGEYIYDKLKDSGDEVNLSSNEEKISSAVKYLNSLNKKIIEHEQLLAQNKNSSDE